MGLETNNDRNVNLPKYRRELIEAIELDLKNDENVLAVFYGGSIGTQEMDRFSDIDLRIVVKDEMYEEYRLKKSNGQKNGEMYYSLKTSIGQIIVRLIILLL